MATGGNFSRSVQGGSDETFDYICSSCETRNNKTVEAKHYCTKCGDFYCDGCLDFHKALPALKNHKVFGRRDVKKWGQQKKSVIIEPCTQHSGKVLEMFCPNHDVLCCPVCVAMEHRLCKGMVYIPEVAKGINQRSEIQKVNQNLDRVKSEMEKLKTTRQKNNATLEKSRSDVLDCITDLRKRANEIFDTLEKNATNEMKKHHRVTYSSIHTDIKTCDDYLAELQQVKQNLQTTSHDDECQLFIQVKKCQQQIQEGDLMIQTVSATATTTSFKYNINSELEKFLTSLKTLGKLEMETSLAIPVKTQTPPYKLQNERKYEVTMEGDDDDCHITGCCQMPDGSILLVDNHNSKLKQLNSSYEVTNHCDISARPTAVCCIDQQKVAVSDINKTIHFLSVGRTKMTVTRAIQMKHQCWGLAYNNGHLYVADYNNKVYIHDTSGKCLRTLYKDNNGVEMFFKTQHIAVSNDGSKIYVADRDKGLVTLTTDGQLLSTFKDKDLNGAYGVCVDGQGSVLVSNWYPAAIIQLDETGTQKLQVAPVSTDGDEHVSSICVDRHNSTLIVTSYSSGLSGKNIIRVYDLA